MAKMDARRMRQNMTKAMDGFTTGQKAMMVIAVVGVVVGVSLFSRGGATTTMAPLFTGLEAADASAITAQLDAQGISYELTEAGRSILVPQADVYRLRIDMSAQGLPSGSNDSWALIDGQGITASAFRQRIDYQRALSGELARTIEALDGVEAAKVNLVIPQNDVFVGDEEQSTASVLVMTRSGVTLGEDEVKSIVNLVASAVPSLTPDAVTVADATGRPLWTPATAGEAGGFAGGSSDATRQTMEFESAMASRLEDLVETIAGPGKARVQVKAELDLDQKATIQEIHAAPTGNEENPLIISQTVNNERYTTQDPTTGGVLGPDGQEQPATEGASTNYQSDNSQVNYAINKLQEETKVAPGQVVRMSVAVAVDESVPDDAVAAIENLVIAAAGLDTAGTDLVSVEKVAFDTTVAEATQAELEAAAAEAAKAASNPQGLIQSVLVGLLVAAVLFMSWRSLRKAAKRAQISETVDLRELQAVREAITPGSSTQPALALGGGDDDDETPGLALPAAEEAQLPVRAEEPEPVLIEPIPMSLAAKTSQQYEAEIREMIDSQTEEAAAVVRNWLSETKKVKR